MLGLTGSAFIPDNEVFAAARTLVGPEDAAVDEDLTASSVLALVQHFLGDKEWQREEEREVKGRRWRGDGERADPRPRLAGCWWWWESEIFPRHLLACLASTLQ